jgi:hypothetical protein
MISLSRTSSSLQMNLRGRRILPYSILLVCHSSEKPTEMLEIGVGRLRPGDVLAI